MDTFPSLGLCFLALLLATSIVPSALAHEGHDHGDGGTPPVSSSPTPTPPSSSMPSDMSGMDMGGMDMSGGQVNMSAYNVTLTGCYAASYNKACIDFQRSDAELRKDIQDLCVTPGMGMPWAIGCGIWESCGDNKLTGASCDPLSIVADLCADMPGMQTCAYYYGLCGSNDSVVAQCKQQTAIIGLIKTAQTQNQIVQMCREMPMSGCEECTAASGSACPKPLSTISKLCQQMPDMAACVTYNNMCKTSGGALDYYCGAGSSGGLPAMRMYFHNSVRDIVLFKKWVPTNNAEYIGTCLFIILVGVLSSAVKACRTSLEAVSVRRRIRASANAKYVDEFYVPFISVEQLQRNLIRAIFTAVAVTLDYFLMLIAMTFNVGFFCCIVAGFSLGTILFGHIAEGGQLSKREQDIVGNGAGCHTETL